MPNLIVGLKYSLQVQKLETENQLLNEFSNLKQNYEKFRENFKITAEDREITSFKSFLEIAVGKSDEKKTSVILRGSGEIGGGLIVKDAAVEYDLTEISDATKYWNVYADGSCHSCHNHYYNHIEQDHSDHCCQKKETLIWKNCPDLNPFIRNSEGKPARTLAELILEASK